MEKVKKVDKQIPRETNGNSYVVTLKKNKDKQNPFLLKRVIEERILKYVKYITFRINTEDGIAQKLFL